MESFWIALAAVLAGSLVKIFCKNILLAANLIRLPFLLWMGREETRMEWVCITARAGERIGGMGIFLPPSTRGYDYSLYDYRHFVDKKREASCLPLELSYDVPVHKNHNVELLDLHDYIRLNPNNPLLGSKGEKHGYTAVRWLNAWRIRRFYEGVTEEEWEDIRAAVAYKRERAAEQILSGKRMKHSVSLKELVETFKGRYGREHKNFKELMDLEKVFVGENNFRRFDPPGGRSRPRRERAARRGWKRKEPETDQVEW